ncbi:hypothetical protein D9M72_350400 [compost metagenome]
MTGTVACASTADTTDPSSADTIAPRPLAPSTIASASSVSANRTSSAAGSPCSQCRTSGMPGSTPSAAAKALSAWLRFSASSAARDRPGLPSTGETWATCTDKGPASNGRLARRRAAATLSGDPSIASTTTVMGNDPGLTMQRAGVPPTVRILGVLRKSCVTC